MLPFFWYMLKVIICSGILFGYYWLFLRNKIFHRYNRFYLLAAMSLSLLLPLLKIDFWQPAPDTNQAIRVLQAVSAGDEYMSKMVLTAKPSNWSLEQLYPVVYILVSLIFLFVVLRTLLLIRTLLKKYPVQRVEEIAFINTEDDSTPFSFLQYIFWNSSIDISTTTGRQIFKHEVAHIQEKHTHDKLFVNLLLIFFWSNPIFWLYRKELNMIHEFIADKKAVEDSDTTAFAAMILQAAYPKHRFELVNNFFYSPIKRRLLMLTKNKNPRVNYLGRIMVLPLTALIFAAFTFKTNNNQSLYHGKKITVAIDAGHGGQDAGATSTGGILEKDLTLAIAKKIKEINSNNAIEIVLVREGDVYMDPRQKVDFAKSRGADLVISLHVDNGPKEMANEKAGLSVFVAKDQFSNAAESKVLASAITNEFSNNYGLAVTAVPKQHNTGTWILQANNCPAVLIETGFINNEKDLAYLQTAAAKETIAKNLLTAIEKYLVGKPALQHITSPSTLQVKQQREADAATVAKADTNPTIRPVTIQEDRSKAQVEFDNRNPDVLYVLDGVIQDKNFNLTQVKANDIIGIDVIKNEAAIARYGQLGKEGVIVIRTKKSEVTGVNPKLKAENEILQLKLKESNIAQEKQNLILEQKIAGNYEFIYNQKLALAKKLESTNAMVVTGYKLDALEKQKKEIAGYNKTKLALSDKMEEVLVQGYAVDKTKLLEKKLEAEKQKMLLLQAETDPMFTGGKEAWIKFLQANLKMNVPVDNGARAGKYTVVLRFMVNADGTLSDIKCENDPGFGICAEALRFIKTTPKWQPAVQNGKKVNAYLKQPITFVVTDQ